MIMTIVQYAAGIYLMYCLLMFFGQRYMIYPTYLLGKPDPPVLKVEHRKRLTDFYIVTENDKKVDAWFISPPGEELADRYPIIIFGHGNGELIDHVLDEAFQYAGWGFGVLLVEYPGYGRSEGKPSEKAITDVFVRAYDEVVAMTSADSDKIIFMGRSLGGAVVSALSRQRKPAAMILCSTFKSLASFAVKFGAPPFLMRDKFNTLAALSAYDGPVLIIHGKNDDIVPYSHGAALSKKAADSRFITYDCKHNDCPPDWGVYERDVIDFLKNQNIFP